MLKKAKSTHEVERVHLVNTETPWAKDAEYQNYLVEAIGDGQG